MRNITVLAIFLNCVAGAASAQPSCTNDNIGNGSIEVFADAAGTNNCLVVEPGVLTTWYVIATLAGGSSDGISGAEFRIEFQDPLFGSGSGLLLWSPNPAATLNVGTPFNTVAPGPGVEFGTNIGFAGCQASNRVLLGTILVFAFSAPANPTTLAVMARTTPSSPNLDCPVFTACDAPVFTKLKLTPNPDALGREGVISRAFVNQPGCIPCNPAGLAIGIFANSTGVPTTLCAERNTPEQFHVLARFPAFTPPGVTGVQFRIEVTQPAGYLFNYTPPNGVQSVGSPLNITPQNTNGPAGVTLLFPQCEDGAVSHDNLVDLGTLSVLNFAGGRCGLSIRGATTPESGSPGCPQFFRCDDPFNTRVCIPPISPSGASFEVGLNIEECNQIPFTSETFLLDTHDVDNDGAAGPVSTSQSLYVGRTFLITVAGTASLTAAASWNAPPAVLCGAPERAPQIASSSVTNYWVGVDPEIQFAGALPAGSNCDDMAALGYPRHHSRLQVDLGNGFEHLEPLGPAPSDPAPGHKYQYVVLGTGTPARFVWVETQTSDNYGVLRITIDDVSPTDATPAQPAPATVPGSHVAVLPNSPDPFNPETDIRWWLASPGMCKVAVFDARGGRVRHIFEGERPAGFHSLRWDGRRDDGSRAATGVYFARVTWQLESATERMVLVK